MHRLPTSAMVPLKMLRKVLAGKVSNSIAFQCWPGSVLVEKFVDEVYCLCIVAVLLCSQEVASVALVYLV